MNKYIPELLRLKYAINMIAFEMAHPNENSEQRCEEYRLQLQLPLTETTPDGKIKAKNGKYLTRLFKNIFGRDIELNTRKRIMGIYSDLSTYSPSEYNKQAITRYLGYKSWERLEKDAKNLIRVYQQEIYGGCYMGTMIGPQRLAKGMFFPSGYQDKEIIEMKLEDGCSLRLLCQGNCKFLVIKVKGLSLKQMDILVISSVLQRGGNLYADEIYREGKVLGSYMGSHPIIDFKTVKQENNKDDIFRKAAEMLKGM